jgi:predicted transcriptional regulator
VLQVSCSIAVLIAHILRIWIAEVRFQQKKRAQIQILQQQKLSHHKIAALLQVSQSAVTRTITRIKEFDMPRSKRQTERPRTTSAKMDRLICCIAIAQPTSSLASIALQLPLKTNSKNVMCRLLVVFQLASRRPGKKARLSAKNNKYCLAFCLKYKDWKKED